MNLLAFHFPWAFPDAPPVEPGPTPAVVPATRAGLPQRPCLHLGDETGETRECTACPGLPKRLKVHVCGAGHGEVTAKDCLTRGPAGLPCLDYKE